MVRWNFWARDPEEDREGAEPHPDGPDSATGAPNAGDRGESAWSPYAILADRARALIAGVRDVLTPGEDDEPEFEAEEARRPHTTTRPESDVRDEDPSDEDRHLATDARLAMGLPGEGERWANRTTASGPVQEADSPSIRDVSGGSVLEVSGRSVREVSSVSVQWASDLDVREAAPERTPSGASVPAGGAAFRRSSGPGSARIRRGRMRRSRRTR